MRVFLRLVTLTAVVVFAFAGVASAKQTPTQHAQRGCHYLVRATAEKKATRRQLDVVAALVNFKQADGPWRVVPSEKWSAEGTRSYLTRLSSLCRTNFGSDPVVAHGTFPYDHADPVHAGA